jgi:lipid A 3-O-deacylase
MPPSDGRPRVRASRATATATALALALAGGAVAGARAEPAGLSLHAQVLAGDATRAASVGVRRALGWEQALGGLRLSAHAEADAGVWSAAQADGSRRAFAQLTVAPVLRLGGEHWFGEVGAGPTWLAPTYRSRQRAFGSRLQFRDHVALGARFGEHGEHALDLRLEHVSNAGIAKPNPGIELVGVRYARHW